MMCFYRQRYPWFEIYGQVYFHPYTCYMILCNGTCISATVSHWLSVTSDISRGLGKWQYLHFKKSSWYNYVMGSLIGPFRPTQDESKNTIVRNFLHLHKWHNKSNAYVCIWSSLNAHHVVGNPLCSLCVALLDVQQNLTHWGWVPHIYTSKLGHHWFR